MWRALRFVVVLTIVSPVMALAGDGDASLLPQPARVAAAASETAPPPATVRFFNRDIVTFRAPYVGHSPAARAKAANQRIREVLAKGGAGTVKVVQTAQALEVLIDGNYTFRILEGDLDANDGETFDEAAVVVARRLDEAIVAARQGGPSRAFLEELGIAALATVVLCLAVWLLTIVRSWIRRRVDAQLTRRLNLGLKEHAGIVRMIRAAGHIVFALLVAVFLEEWLRFVLSLFPYTRPWANSLTGFVAGIIAQVWTGSIDAVPGLVMVALIAALAELVTRMVRIVARGIEAGRLRLFGIDAEVVQPTRRLVTAGIWLFALAMAYPYLPGSSSQAFKGLSVLLGVMLSLGASGIVGQAAGGFILTYSRALRSGEWVRVGDVEGAVVGIGVFSTKIRTYTDEEISIPNTVILATTTRNFSRPAAGRASILETSVTIGYSAPWRLVHDLLLEAATRTPELEREPPAEVLQTALSDFYIQYSLRVRLRNQLRRPAVLSALNANILDTFNEHGVQIMSPHYVFDPPAPVIVPKERWLESSGAKPPAPRKDSARSTPG